MLVGVRNSLHCSLRFSALQFVISIIVTIPVAFYQFKEEENEKNYENELLQRLFFFLPPSLPLSRSYNLLSHFNYSAGWDALAVTFPSILIQIMLQ